MNCPTRSSLYITTSSADTAAGWGQTWQGIKSRQARCGGWSRVGGSVGLLCPPGPALITINTKSCSLRGITTPVCIHMSLSLSDKQKISPRGRLTLTSVVQVLWLVMWTEGTPTHLTRREAAPLLSGSGPFTNILPAGGHSHYHHYHHQHEPVLHLQIPLRYIPPW